MKKPSLMVIGLDSVSLTLLDAFAKHCPNIRKLMRQGTTGRAVPCFPVYTPTNWAALSTGADPGATAAAAWHNERAGQRLSTFDRRAIMCETIFDSAARDGLTTLALFYPTAWPAGSRNNMVLAPLDKGLVSNCVVPGRIVDVKLDAGGQFRFDLLLPPEAMSGASLAKAVGATEDGASLSGKGRRTVVNKATQMVISHSGGKWTFSGAGLSGVALVPGKWSEPLTATAESSGRRARCMVRIMLMAGGRRVAISEAYDVGRLLAPAELAKEALSRLGPPIEHSVFFARMNQDFAAGRLDKEIETLTHADMDAQADWIADAAELAMKRRPFDVFYLHHHYPDSVLHHYLCAAEGLSPFSKAQQAFARRTLARCLETCDALVGRLAAMAGPKTTVLLVSDHGTVSNRYSVNIKNRLVDSGLTKLAKDGSVNIKASLAYVGNVQTWVHVNAAPGSRRYEELQEKVIDSLLDWRSPEGKRVVALALRRKDSHLLGYFGPESGDVTFHYNAGFSWFGKGPRSVYPDTSGANHGPRYAIDRDGPFGQYVHVRAEGPGVPARRAGGRQRAAGGHGADGLLCLRRPRAEERDGRGQARFDDLTRGKNSPRITQITRRRRSKQLYPQITWGGPFGAATKLAKKTRYDAFAMQISQIRRSIG